MAMAPPPQMTLVNTNQVPMSEAAQAQPAARRRGRKVRTRVVYLPFSCGPARPIDLSPSLPFFFYCPLNQPGRPPTAASAMDDRNDRYDSYTPPSSAALYVNNFTATVIFIFSLRLLFFSLLTLPPCLLSVLVSRSQVCNSTSR